MIKTDQTDYAAAYRQYCTYGRGRTLKKFCEDEDYNYTKLRRYIDKSFWNASKAERDSIGCIVCRLRSDKPIQCLLKLRKQQGSLWKQIKLIFQSALFRYSLATVLTFGTIAALVFS